MIKIPIWLSRRNIILIFISLASMVGAINTIHTLLLSHARRQQNPYFFGGDLFTPIKQAIGHEKYVGYLTDRDISKSNVSARFTQAQFALAPAILDFNNAEHRLLILDFEDPKLAVATGQKLMARPLKRSPQGIIFAERPEQ